MGQTDHGKIGRKLKEDKFTSKYKAASKGSNTNTDLILYVPKTLLKREVRIKPNMLILLSTVFIL